MSARQQDGSLGRPPQPPISLHNYPHDPYSGYTAGYGLYGSPMGPQMPSSAAGSNQFALQMMSNNGFGEFLTLLLLVRLFVEREGVPDVRTFRRAARRGVGALTVWVTFVCAHVHAGSK